MRVKIMREKVKNYYNGFAPEPEIQFISEISGERRILRIWEGYFDDIMVKIEPTSTGWTGLAYYYHLFEGWYDESPWEIPDLELAIEQFSKINKNDLKETPKNVLSDIIELLKDAQLAKEKVIITYY